MRRIFGLFAVVAAILLLLPACPKKNGGTGPEATPASQLPVGEMIQKPWDKFKGEIPNLTFGEFDKWQSNNDYKAIGDPRAVKGGTLRMAWTSYPTTLRTDGPNSNLSQLSDIQGMVYEGLIGTHSETLEFVPSLANEWMISKDLRTFGFRIDKNARWSDGSEVTADDVLASWEHRANPDRKDPFNVITYKDNFEKPVVVDKYTITVKTKKLNWRLFLYFGGMAIYPAKYIRISGEKYLEEYQWKMMIGSGPYVLDKMEKQESFQLKRRDDYWDKDNPKGVGTNNFEKLRWIVVREREIELEKFKKGELDYFRVSKAQRWAEECDFDLVKKGWVQKRQIYTQKPQGFSGLVFNMRKPPFDDIRVRKAFCHLFNREMLIDKLFFNQYRMIDSYYPGRVWGNPDNEKIRYNPEKAAKLLAEAGWKDRNEDGWLVDKDGKIFEIELEYPLEDWKRIWGPVAECYEKAGIKFDLALVDWRTTYQKVQERNFTIHHQSWGAILFPNPEGSWMSALADEKFNNNVPGFKNKRVDELCELEKKTFDLQERVKILREIDGLIFKEHTYALGWSLDNTRLLYWYHMGHPEWYFTKTASNSDERQIKSLWWFDPDKSKALEDAKKAG